ncbi:MAG: F0F1 ATP synthase subunit epsilon [Thermodesulfobacteriota bacterium]|nr:F0F1 ATP synthase subunit epsilon [Thermodesulfobacteriota bacterium]
MKTMSLKLMLPTEVLLETPVIKVIAEAENGSFCLLPRHIDFTAALVPGILLFTDPDGTEQYGALDSGILVKCGNEVLISAFNAVLDKDLSRLQQLVVEHFVSLNEQQQTARSALARLEAGVVRRFIEVEEHRHG